MSSGVQIIHSRDRDSCRKVTFVDTPGFDDSRGFNDLDDSCLKFTDMDILKMIVDFLVREYVYLLEFNPLSHVLMAICKV